MYRHYDNKICLSQLIIAYSVLNLSHSLTSGGPELMFFSTTVLIGYDFSLKQNEYYSGQINKILIDK